MKYSIPNKQEFIVCFGLMGIWFLVTAPTIGIRPEHVFLSGLIFFLFFAGKATRRLLAALSPFGVFALSYDWMNLVPNYVVNPVDIEGIYQAEKSLFGIVTAAGTLTPNEFFTLHNHPVVDFLCGCFYLCWVPVPMLFGIYLYFARKEKAYLHFALVFLLVNYIGFVGYYLHPAAPPWYYAQFGPELIHNTGGSAAGLAAFDKIIGADMFTTIYTRTSNVFAAVPSLHSAYTFVAFIYSVHAKAPRGWQIALGIITVGIWFTAVYTSHHYIIDVILGMGCALLGYWLFEYGLMRIRPFAKFINGYVSYITPKK